MMRTAIWWVGALALLSACGPAGTISGRVTVEGGSPGGHAVIVYGPQSAATVTGDDGTFNFTGLPDGKYVVSATVDKADDPNQVLATTITNGAANPAPAFTFRASNARVSGRVVFADGSDAANLTVIATGPETRGVRTAAGGAFEFADLKNGAYVVSVEAKDTREGRVGVGVNAAGSTEAVELRLSPIGRVGGIVSYNSMPAQGVTVSIPGTSLVAITDDKGAYAFDQAPTGPQTILARIGSEPFWRSATAMVTIVRGENPAVPLTLSDDAPRSGTVTGVVTFAGARSPRDITVTVPGTGAMATPQVNGSFSLTVPVGTWDVVATAPLHPAKSLGRVTVTEGSTQAIVGQELSWYRPIWRSNQAISGLSASGGFLDTGTADPLPWGLVEFSEGGVPRLALIHLTSGEFRILSYNGGTDTARLSRNAKYAGWRINNTAFVYEVATGTISTFSAIQNIINLEFSSDETALFIHRGGQTLTRVRLGATPTSETFPTTGTSTSIEFSTVDRWFVREGTSVRLVTDDRDVPNVFQNVAIFSVNPTWALTNCAATCELRVLASTSESPAVRDTAVNPTNGTVSLFGGALESRTDFPCFIRNLGLSSEAFCVRAMDGTHFPLPAVPTQFRLNQTGDRVIWVAPNGAQTALREEAFPPGPSTSPVANNTVGYQTRWISPTRAAAIENSGAPSRVIHLYKSGVASTESDIGPQAVPNSGPLLVFPRAATSRWNALLGDGMPRQIDVPTNIGVTGFGARPLGTGPMPTSVTRYASVSFDASTSYIIDEAAGMLRQTSVGNSTLGFSLRSGTTEYGLFGRNGTTVGFVYNTGATFELFEYGSPAVLGNLSLNAWVAIADDARTLMLGGFQ